MIRLYATGAVLVFAFLVGWTANGWRLGEKIEKTERTAQHERAEAFRLVRAAETKADETIRAADVTAQRELAENEKRLSDFERCIADGSGCGLRVKVRTISTSCVPTGETAGLGVGISRSAELDPSSGPDYRALRLGIRRLEAALKVCTSGR